MEKQNGDEPKKRTGKEQEKKRKRWAARKTKGKNRPARKPAARKTAKAPGRTRAFCSYPIICTPLTLTISVSTVTIPSSSDTEVDDCARLLYI